MQAVVVHLVPFHLLRHTLLGHKHLAAQGRCQCFEFVPSPQFQMGDRLTLLETEHGVAQSLGHGHGGFGVRVGIHINQLAFDQQFLASEDARLEQDGRGANARATQAHMQQVVVLG